MQLLYKLFSFTFLILLLTAGALQAQDLAPCGTELGVSPWLRDFQQRINSSARTNEVLYLPIQVHVVGNDQGSGYMSKKAVFAAFCTLNEDFVQANIQFFLANPINYINNSNYYNHDFEGGYEMMVDNNFSNAINCYIVESPAGNCGYFFPGAPDAIALSKGCTGPNDHTWAHEVGHYLSLPHPFFGWEGETHDYDLPAPASWDGWQVEKLDGSNCNNSGDGFCDTAPDYLNYRWNCNSAGVSSTVQTDPNGETFVSDGTLFMSYSNPFCKSTFSADQIAAMRANVTEERPYLLTIPPAPENLLIEEQTTIDVISPAAGEILTGGTITLEWEPITNATHYLVQVNPFNFFSIVFEEQLVATTSIELTDLQSNRTHYWRIKPINNYYTCANFTSSSSFETGLTTATNELLPGESFDVFPNPASGGLVSMRLSTPNNSEVQWQLTDSRGSLQQKGHFQATTGTQIEPLEVKGLPAGIYFLRLQLEERQAVEKLIIY